MVVGGGNAALVSALSASDEGARVLVLERAPKVQRGGNSRHTRNIRCVHNQADDYNTGAYTFDELWSDLCGIGTGPSDERLAELTVRESESAPAWMSQHGARWQQPLTGTLHLGRTNRFFLGGGKALLNAYYRTAERHGITVDLRHEGVEALRFAGDTCSELVVSRHGDRQVVRARPWSPRPAGSRPTSAGWRATGAWRPATTTSAAPTSTTARSWRICWAVGAARAGDERGFHAVAVDARSPKFDGGIATRLDCIPFGVVVNRDGRRFYDEGEDIWPKRYATWGGSIAAQPDQIAYALWDRKVRSRFLPPMYGAYEAGTVAELAGRLGLDPGPVTQTVAEYNQAVADDAGQRFDPAVLDGLATRGISPPKSNWAQRIDQPPFFGVPMRPGITFTYLGVAVTERAQVRTRGRLDIGNVFAAGEMMSGNILSTGYLAGFGMTIGTVSGSDRRTRGGTPCPWMTCSPRRSGSSTSATLAATARDTARSGPPWRGAPTWRRVTSHLANLCHDCRDCFTACMYTAPHEFDLNPPQVFTQVREETYRSYVWPQTVPVWLRGRGGVALAFVATTAVLGLLSVLTSGNATAAAPTSGSPYDVLPHLLLVVLVGLPSLWTVGVLGAAVARYWHDTHGRLGYLTRPRLWASVLADGVQLRHLRGAGEPCGYPQQTPNPARRRLHLAVTYGFGLCVLSTTSAAVLQEGFDQTPPYPVLSVPVLTGTAGGLALMAGSVGLVLLKGRSDTRLGTDTMRRADYGLLWALLILALTGLLTLTFRDGALFRPVLVIHLAAVMVAFAITPYTKFVHWIYRLLALYKDGLDRDQAR